ncbi:phospholipid carrier-dependent glycosyltransferase [Candidatus Beckwithbacteria bacterium]|nr:phospholipid carrier-dependent glycosyltransferase [Candidatus Beckwithbacteria bacterium]
MKKQDLLLRFLPFCITGLLIVIFYSLRWVFLTPFDLSYLEDLYGHSQWMIPQSNRVMSDNELYQLAGYRYIQGADLFSINPEVPPLGKYFYGLAATYLTNPYWAAALLFLTTTIIFYVLTKEFTNSKKIQLIGVLLLLTSPLYAMQLGRTMLDLPQLFWLLLHILAILKLSKEKSSYTYIWLLVTGISLGGFAASKFPIYTPILVLADGFLLFKRKKIAYIIPLLGIALISYIATFLPYFLQNPNLINWLKNEKWTVDFYAKSQKKADVFITISTVMVGRYLNIWGSQGWQSVRNWSLVWPVTAVMVIWQGVLLVLKKIKDNETENYILIICGLLLVSFITLSFYPHYFLLFLPLGILLLLHYFEQNIKILGLLVGISLLQLIFFMRPDPNEMLYFANQDWQNGNFQDLYQHLNQDSKNKITRQEFLIKNKVIENNLHLLSKKITTAQSKVMPWQNTAYALGKNNFKSELGNLDHAYTLQVTRENNVWKILWNWDNVLPDLHDFDQVVFVPKPAKQGILYTADYIALTKPALLPYIWINPDKIQNKDLLIRQMNNLTNHFAYTELENYLFVQNQGVSKIEIGFLEKNYDETLFQELKQDPAVVIEDRLGRWYHERFFDVEKFYQSGNLEEDYKQIRGRDGGEIIIRNPNNQEKILLSKLPVDGEDAILSVRLADVP